MKFLEFAENLEKIDKISNSEIKLDSLIEFITSISLNEISECFNLCHGKWDLPTRSKNISKYSGLKIENKIENIKQLDYSNLDEISLKDLYIYLNRNYKEIDNWKMNKDNQLNIFPTSFNNISNKWFSKLLGVGIIKEKTIKLILNRVANERGGNENYGIQALYIYENILSDAGAIIFSLVSEGVEALEKIFPYPDFPLPGFPFKPETISDWQSIIEGCQVLGEGPYIVQPKYRGEQINIHINNGKIYIYDRNRIEVSEYFLDIKRKLNLSNMIYFNAIFDAEVVGIDGETGNNVSDFHTRNVSYHKVFIFDLVYFEGKNWSREIYSRRRKKYKVIISELFNIENIFAIDEIELDSVPEVENVFNEYVINRNFEGIILKDRNGIYMPSSKSKYKGRVKQYRTLDVVILGYWKKMDWRATFLVGLWNKDKTKFESFRVAENVKGGKVKVDKLISHLSDHIVSEKPDNVISEVAPEFWVNPETIVEIKSEGYKLHSMKYNSNYTLAGGVVILRKRIDKSLADIDNISQLLDYPSTPKT